jgi:hypothetical protein
VVGSRSKSVGQFEHSREHRAGVAKCDEFFGQCAGAVGARARRDPNATRSAFACSADVSADSDRERRHEFRWGSADEQFRKQHREQHREQCGGANPGILESAVELSGEFQHNGCQHAARQHHAFVATIGNLQRKFAGTALGNSWIDQLRALERHL